MLVSVTAFPAGLRGEDAERLDVRSPDGGLAVFVHAGDALAYSVLLDGETLLAPSPISMTLGDGRVLGAEPEVKGAERSSEDTVLRPVVRVKNEEVRDHFNELTVDLGEVDLVVRAYDDDAAYRFRTRLDGEIVVAGERVTFAFAADHRVHYPLEEGFVSRRGLVRARRPDEDHPGDGRAAPLRIERDQGPG